MLQTDYAECLPEYTVCDSAEDNVPLKITGHFNDKSFQA